ncbi:tRNA-dihydrouridine synthase [Saccharospirillum salsuginis]|uniref:tRNA-dihydrouridine(16) synthase n=1 Tax=Saccharospirillum salsuginis TaxID=418750 RepID=A0A918NET8_9GAMM|nr:tRNA-dihydrouridine synthase [Saccharospirillum salsuginis]GGX61890.1 tRNA-dihydrouridine(16) synthase [Saccharospirillum salsuginis]
MRLILAPMEGLADVYLRRLITAQGGFDRVVSEFVRVVDQRLPERVFYTVCPELLEGGRTRSGTPVRVQLLGNHLEAMAANAQRAIELGSDGLDLNFGCPSKTVNRSQGGAILLREPETLYRVVRSVRRALPEGVTLSAKMRLGFEDTGLMFENAAAIEAGGADELTVHARTKVQGYAPPAHWHELGRLNEQLNIPLIANGDIWTVDDYQRCCAITGTTDVMLGRGAIRTPDLARRIRKPDHTALPWSEYRVLLAGFWSEVRAQMPDRYCAGRLKQWVNHLRQAHTEAEAFWHRIRTERNVAALDRLLLDLD